MVIGLHRCTWHRGSLKVILSARQHPQTLKPIMHQVSSQKTTVSAMLHPQVQLALAYLDCHLEDELVRYRRARSGSQVAPSSAGAMRSSNKAKTPAQVELTQFIAIDALPKKPMAVDSDIPVPIDNLSAEEMLSGLAVNNDGAHSGNSFSSEDQYSLDALMANSGGEISDDRSLSLSDSFSTDYLESSEELLRSLAEEEAGAEQERGSIESLLTPLGIGSMMLMLIGSGMFGYLVMNPSTLTALGSAASRFVSGVKLPQSAPSVTAPVTVNGEIPKDGNEFVDLSLNNLVVMGTQGKGSGLLKMPDPIAPNAASTPSGLVVVKRTNAGTPLVIPSQSGRSTANSSQPGVAQPIVVQPPARPSLYRPVQPQKKQTSRTPAVNTVPSPSSPTATPSASSEPSIAPATGGYRVEIPYTGDTALEKAQKSDAGAYFKNGENGAVIQMGESYQSREAAEAKAQQLKQQGFEGVEVQK